MKKVIINAVNKEQNGELYIGEVNIAPFENFPNLTLQLDSIRYFENKKELRLLEERPVAALSKFFVSIDVISLCQGNINIGAIKLLDGEVNLIQHSDSTLNLTNALGIDLTDTTRTNEPVDTTKSIPPAFNIQLDRFSMNNINLVAYNQVTEKGIGVLVHNINTSLTYNKEIISNSLDIDVELLGVKDKDRMRWQHKNMSIDTKVNFHRTTKIMDIYECDLQVEGAQLELNGTVDIPNDLDLDLNIKASQKDLNIINLLANGKVDLDKIKKNYSSTLGGITFDAKVSGKSKNRLPKLEANLSVDQLTLKSLDTSYGLNDLSLEASLNTGNSSDLDQLEFHLKKFNLETTNGYARGTVDLTNGIKTPRMSLKWEANIDLNNFDDLLTNVPIDSLKGHVDFKADVAYIIDVKNKKILNPSKGEQKVALKIRDVSVMHSPTGVKPRDINGIFYIWDNHLGIKDFTAKIDNSDLKFNGNIDNLIFWALGMETDIDARVRLQSDHLLLKELVRYSDTMKVDMVENMHDIDVDFTMHTTSNNLNDYTLFPYGQLELHNMQSSFDNFKPIHDVTGFFGIGKKRLGVKYLKGNIGESDFSFTGGFENYDGVVFKDSTITIKSGFNITSNSMRVVDFFTYGDSLLIPNSFVNEKLNSFQIQGGVDVSNQELFSGKKVPNFRLWMNGLKWRLSITPLIFRDFEFELVKEDNEIKLNDFTGKVGQSDMKFNAQLYNITDSTRKDFNARFQVDAKMINFNELLKLTLPLETYEASSQSRAQAIQDQKPIDIFAIKYPNMVLDVSVDRMKLMDMDIVDFDGTVSTSKDKKITLDKVSVKIGDIGKMNMSGVADLQDPQNVIMKGDVSLKNIDLSQIDLEVDYDGEKINISENFDGIMNSDMSAKARINKDLSIDIANTTADIKMTLENGRVVNFGPLQAMGSYFGNKNMNNIRFDKLENDFTIKDGIFYIPRMDISSTIGQIYVSGEQHLDMQMKYLVEVPFKLVRSVAWNTLIGGKKKKHGEEDSIQKDEGGKYVAVRIEGNVDDYKIKLGKGRKNK
ncbi:MAG: AsmA-like C-terminal region-containing protein [Prolixibacteraceae bacterium]|nr:AsmA-like C-terminal region-containing protein [Prolixibacteraceae bacterium]